MINPRIRPNAWSPSATTHEKRHSPVSHVTLAMTGFFGLGVSAGLLVGIARMLGFGG